MALWGNKDSKSVTGTIAVTNGSKAVVGTGTTFTTQLKSGNTLVIANVEYRVESITDNTHLTLHVPYAGSTATGVSVTANEQPAYISDIPAPRYLSKSPHVLYFFQTQYQGLSSHHVQICRIIYHLAAP